MYELISELSEPKERGPKPEETPLTEGQQIILELKGIKEQAEKIKWAVRGVGLLVLVIMINYIVNQR
jgi:hypothetical protein